MATEVRSTHTARPSEPLAAEATVALLNRIKSGDDSALEVLLERCLPVLQQWAHGRLPRFARGIMGTVDLVQEAVMASIPHLHKFEARHQGAVQAYFRQAVMNKVRDLVRQHKRRPRQTTLSDELPAFLPSPLDQAIHSEKLARYEAAMQRLKASDREAIIGRVELQYEYDQLAILLNKTSPDAARMAVMRAMKRLMKEMCNVS